MFRLCRALLSLAILISLQQFAAGASGPAMAFSTFLGGSGGDGGSAVATDSAGNIYVAGATSSPSFPGTRTILRGTDDVFVSKYTPGGQLLYSTRVGGSGFDEAYAIAVDQDGFVYVTGATGSSDFNVVRGFQAHFGGGFADAFIVKLDSFGKVVYSSFLGGAGGNEAGNGIAVDAFGNAYVAGRTDSTDFPLSHAFQNTFGGGIADAFIVKINTRAKGAVSLVYSSYLGGFGFESGNGIAVDSTQNAYVTGTAGCCFPTTPDAFQTFVGNSYYHAFVSKVSANGSLIYSTLIGGGNQDSGRAIATDQSGNAYVTGETSSSDFPISPLSFQSTIHGQWNAFLTKLNPSVAGSSGLVYSTYLGGEATDSGSSIAVDSTGRIFASGYTSSTKFPTQNPIQSTLGGNKDAFLVQLDPSASGSASLLFGTYLGGSNEDQALGIRLAPKGLAVITGFTSAPFPLVNPFQPTWGGSTDAFVAAIALNPGVLTTTALTSSQNPSFAGQSVTFTATVTASGSAPPTGTVIFRQDYTRIGTFALTNGQASVTVNYSNPGAHSVTAWYSGDTNYLDSTSLKLRQIVKKAP